MHSTVLLYAFIGVVFTTTLCNLGEAHVLSLHCTPCLNDFENGCDDPPAEICVFGEVRDKCGRRVCGKGPGEKCGGHFGVCGEGMSCTTSFLGANIPRCHGCTLYANMECFPVL